MTQRGPTERAAAAGPLGGPPGGRGGARDRLSTTFAALSERDFAWFFCGNLAFFMATQMQFVIRGYLTFELTGSAAAIGYVTAAGALPMLLGSPIRRRRCRPGEQEAFCCGSRRPSRRPPRARSACSC